MKCIERCTLAKINITLENFTCYRVTLCINSYMYPTNNKQRFQSLSVFCLFFYLTQMNDLIRYFLRFAPPFTKKGRLFLQPLLSILRKC